MKKLFGSIALVLLLTLLLLGVPKLAGLIAGSFDFQLIDPDGAFALLSLRHIIMGLIILAAIGVISKFKPINFGFNWGDREVGKQYLKLFFLYFSLYTVGAYLVVLLSNSFQHFPYTLTATNIIGHMGFQLLLSGPVEELVFRAFAITILSLLIKDRLFNGKVSIASIIAAIIFGLAHMSFSLFPFQISFDTFQIIYAIVLGIIYGDCYEKTGSIFYPMIMHSFTNVLMVAVLIMGSFYMLAL